MSFSLADALHGIPLDVGQTYRCEVDGRLVEVRILPTPTAESVCRSHTKPIEETP